MKKDVDIFYKEDFDGMGSITVTGEKFEIRNVSEGLYQRSWDLTCAMDGVQIFVSSVTGIDVDGEDLVFPPMDRFKAPEPEGVLTTGRSLKIRFYVADPDAEAEDRYKEIMRKATNGCFTTLYGKGTWKGQEEQSIVFEYIADKDQGDFAFAPIAEALRKAGNQECVLFTTEPVVTGMVAIKKG